MVVPLRSDPESITSEWLTAALHGAGRGAGAKVVSLTADVVGTGQMGRNVRFHLSWDRAVDDAPKSVVGKFPSPDPTSRATGAAQGAYAKEVEFYRQLAPTLDIRTPHCFFAAIDADGASFVLLLEDISPAAQGDQIAGCGIDRAALALEELAKLHAPRWCDPALAELEFLFGPAERGEMMQEIYQAVWPGFAARYADRLEPEVLALSERLGPAIGRWVAGYDRRLTVVHGDYRLDNMLFGAGPGAPPLAVVDWQTVSRGVGAADAAYFLGAGLSVEDRRRHERELMRGYWEALTSRGVEGFSWDDCWHGYRYTAFGGVAMAVVASMLVQQTARGDDMFVAMASRHGRHALDLESEKLLP